ncbi:MAG: hypothetical protein ABFD97_14265 [Syntrophobacter sp.]
MTRTPFGGFGSFRGPTRKISAFPEARDRTRQVWRPSLNEKVLIPHGVGIVSEISGDMYLIDLENQVANVWERLTSIKPLM